MAQPTTTTKVPLALAKNARKAADAKLQRTRQQAVADLALCLRRRTEINEAFYDMGEALARLEAPGVAQLVGFASFADLCEVKLDLSLTHAHTLISIVKNVPREQALKMGQTRAAALVSLAQATPDPDSASSLANRTIALPSGELLDLRRASTRQIEAAARELRAADRPGLPVKGRGVTLADRDAAAAVQQLLRAAGVATATVKAIAGSPGASAVLRIDAPMQELVAALAKKAGKRG